MKHVFIDVDTGVDDAIAILLAIRSPELKVLGISTVCGNVDIEQTYRNTLAVLDIAGADPIPVAKGMEAPLVRPLITAKEIHGSSGLGGVEIPSKLREGSKMHGVDLMIDSILQSAEPVTVILVGPLTNMAVALMKNPSIKEHIAELVIMGGAGAAGGNVTAAAEFNIYVDPEAAKIVFASGLPIRLVTWDVCLQANLNQEEVDELGKSNDPAVQLAYQLVQYLQQIGANVLCDPTAMCAVLNEDILETEYLPVEVETAGEVTRGMTLIDIRSFVTIDQNDQRPMLHVATRLNRELFRDVFMKTLLNKE